MLAGVNVLFPYQYFVTVNDSVEPVSNGEDCAVLKLVPNSLLDEAVSSKKEQGTQHLRIKRRNLSFCRALGRDFTKPGKMSHQQKKKSAIPDKQNVYQLSSI